MKNKSPELILDFTDVTGEARKVLSKYAQERLFKMGYNWSANPATRNKAQHTDAGGLYVNSSEWDSRHITYAIEQYQVAGEYVNSDGVTARREVYDAATQLEAFLEAAQDAVVEVANIQGVSVTITRKDIKLDTTAFLTSVTEQARRIQKDIFGHNE